MKTQTLVTLRNVYYLGIITLIINALPFTEKYLTNVFGYVVFGALDVISLIAIFVLIATVYSYNRGF